MKAFEASRTDVAKWKWPVQYVAPACRCDRHSFAHCHPPFESWDSEPIKPATATLQADENNREGGLQIGLGEWEREISSETEEQEAITGNTIRFHVARTGAVR
jgi:hypothetical protein